MAELDHLTARSGVQWLLAFGSGYPGGRLVTLGGASPDGDMLFREGIILDREQWLKEELIPEPSVTLLGAAAVGLASLMRAFRRQGT